MNLFKEVAVANVIPHPDYTKTPIGLAIHDIMLLKLAKNVVYNDWVRPACLPVL